MKTLEVFKDKKYIIMFFFLKKKVLVQLEIELFKRGKNEKEE